MKHLLPACLLLLLACDNVNEDKDFTTTRTIQMVTSANKSAVIDLQKIFTNYKSVDFTSGTGMEYFGNRYVKYNSTGAGQNQFSFRVGKSDNSITNVNVQASVKQVSSCDQNLPFTYAKISNKDLLVVNLLNNPEFCTYDIYVSGEMGIASSRKNIDVDENSDGVNIELCSCGPEGHHAILTYVPPIGFTGQVKFKYYLHANADYNAHGEEIFYDPQYSEYFSAHEVIIDVTN